MAEGDEREILALLRAQEEANARGDAAAVLAPMAEEIVSYDLPPPLEHRGDTAQGAGNLKEWFDSWDGPVTVELTDPTMLVDGDPAVVFGLSRMKGVKKGSGPLDSWNRRTMVLRRTAGAWRIVHEHNSYPMMMDGSSRAATDLKP